MDKISINIKEDYSATPGGRKKQLGSNSGEEFYEDHLLPKYIEAVSKKVKLEIDLDGVAGYPSSFLDQAFGTLARTYSTKEVSDVIVFVTHDFRWIVEYIRMRIWDIK